MNSENFTQEVYGECIEYVRKTLKDAGRDAGRRHPFRSRIAHTLRVLKWAERLIEGRNDVNRDVLFMAVIFHDVGYVTDDLSEHQKVSEKIFREYAKLKNFTDEFIEKTAHCIAIHSDKEAMKQPEQLTIEEILLMEADLLDEEGALAICWDGLACGWEGKYSYEESYERTILEAGLKLNTQPMVTEKAKKFWQEKQQFLQEYMKQLSRDLQQWSVEKGEEKYMFKAIIFDFDYTLGDSTNGIALSVNYALEQLGHEPKEIEDIRRTIGLSLKETYFALTSNEELNAAERFAEFFKEKADKVMVDNAELYSGVKDVLQKLKAKGYKTAIVTTKFRYRIEQILNKFDANDLIDIIVGAEDVKVEKPSPEGLLGAISHLEMGNEDVLYVGDSFVDAKTAENANVNFAAVLTGTTTREEFEKYNNVYIGENISDIYNYITNLSI